MFEHKAKDFLPLGFLKFVGSFEWNKTTTQNMLWTSTYSILESLQSSLIVTSAQNDRLVEEKEAKERKANQRAAHVYNPSVHHTQSDQQVKRSLVSPKGKNERQLKKQEAKQLPLRVVNNPMIPFVSPNVQAGKKEQEAKQQTLRAANNPSVQRPRNDQVKASFFTPQVPLVVCLLPYNPPFQNIIITICFICCRPSASGNQVVAIVIT